MTTGRATGSLVHDAHITALVVDHGVRELLTVDRDFARFGIRTVPRAKRYARAQGLSLSQLIENALREMGAGETTLFSERWRGRFRPAERPDDRYRRLAEKYR